ncbi:hypothetical protein T03_17209 [Trichinella britovi]|uniref:Uncharacterized protein n=1 Tax=Trichinella britovi TaxID=45882 RepID=A0A0V1C611_TRIBR|nr:hypothetical protein T03_17209 [Trichinella britovi]
MNEQRALPASSALFPVTSGISHFLINQCYYHHVLYIVSSF